MIVIEQRIEEAKQNLLNAREDLIKALRLLVSYYEGIDQYWDCDSDSLPPSVEAYINRMRDLIGSLEPRIKSLNEEVERNESRLSNLNEILGLRVKIMELGDLKEEIEKKEGYESTDEWTEVRLDIQGCRRQIELLKEGLDE